MYTILLQWLQKTEQLQKLINSLFVLKKRQYNAFDNNHVRLMGDNQKTNR